MKRPSILFVGLLSAVLMFSVVGLADLSGTTPEATLHIYDVIDVSLASSLNDVDIDQDTDLDTWNNNSISKLSFGTFTVKIITMTNYSTTINYSATVKDGTATTNPGSVGGDPLYIDSSTHDDGSVTGLIGAVNSLDADFTGTNSMNSAGEYQQYDLKLDPAELTADFEAGNEVDFTVTVTLDDNTV